MMSKSHQAHHVPQHLQQRVQIELLGTGYGDAVRLSRYRLHLLHAAQASQRNRIVCI